MSYRSRVLPEAEWSRLAGTPAESVLSVAHPENTRVLVVEHDGAIVGVMTMLRVIHAESLWIAPAYRRQAVVGRRLIEAMYRQSYAWSAKAILGHAMSTVMDKVCRRLQGSVVPGRTYVLPVGEPSCHQP